MNLGGYKASTTKRDKGQCLGRSSYHRVHVQALQGILTWSVLWVVPYLVSKLKHEMIRYLSTFLFISTYCCLPLSRINIESRLAI